MKTIEKIHAGYIYGRRIQVLRDHLCAVLPQNCRVLDVGCGDGNLARLIMERRPDVRISGIDVHIQPKLYIEVKPFDGMTMPAADKSFDAVMFVDVLHHTLDPNILLREAARVASKAVIIKDHTRDGWCAEGTLRFMDRIGNERHGVSLPYNYWPETQWRSAYKTYGLSVTEWRNRLGLYPFPLNVFFERSLHFIAKLDVAV